MMLAQRNGTEWLGGQHLLILLWSSRPCKGRVAVHLHMSVGRVVVSPRQIRRVRPQLAIHGAPIRSEPLIKIIKDYDIIFFDWMYPWTGSFMGVAVRASSQLERLYFNSMFLRLGGKLSACITRLFILISISWSSLCRTIGSVEAVAATCPGNVHTALKRHAPLRLLIRPFQTNREGGLQKYTLLNIIATN